MNICIVWYACKQASRSPFGVKGGVEDDEKLVARHSRAESNASEFFFARITCEGGVEPDGAKTPYTKFPCAAFAAGVVSNHSGFEQGDDRVHPGLYLIHGVTRELVWMVFDIGVESEYSEVVREYDWSTPLGFH